MRRKLFAEERIIGGSKEAEAGAKSTDLCRRHGIEAMNRAGRGGFAVRG